MVYYETCVTDFDVSPVFGKIRSTLSQLAPIHFQQMCDRALGLASMYGFISDSEKKKLQKNN